MTSSPAHGLVLVKGTIAASARWLRRGLVAVRVVDLPGWTGVVVAQESAESAAPYDGGLEVLAARPAPGRQRPALGFLVIDDCAVVTVQPRGLQATQRWLVWDPERGVTRTPALPGLPPATLLEAAEAEGRARPAEVVHALRAPREQARSALDVLVDLLHVLGLPGEELLVGGGQEQHELVSPSPRSVRAFDAMVQEQAAHREAHEESR